MDQDSTDIKTDTADSMMNAHHIHRWYDSDVQLGELVRCLETLSEESQMLFAFLLTLFSDEIARLRGMGFFREMEWGKLMGIYKSRQSRRWYDREPVLHKAFNKLYSLNDGDKAAVAGQLYPSSRIVAQYEGYCKAQSRQLDLETICAIVETSFAEGPDAAEKRYVGFK